MSNNLNKHQWEEQAWEQMEILLDEELPVTSVQPYDRWLFAAVFLFILGSGAIMLFLPDHDVSELSADSINNDSELSYSVAAVDVNPGHLADRSLGWRDITSANLLDRGWTASVSSFPSLEADNFHGSLNQSIGEEFLVDSDREISVSGLRGLDIDPLSYQSFDFRKMQSNETDIFQPHVSNSSSLLQFVEGNTSYLTEGHWGLGFHYGLHLKLSNQWSGSIAAGYQYHRFAGIQGENNYSVPLLLPGPGSGEVQPNTSNENNSIILPELHPNLHQLSLTAQLTYTPWKERGIQLAALVRGQRNMYYINPEVVNSPIRFSYRALNTTKQQSDWSHYSLSIGAGMSYALNPRWEIHTRAFYTNNFIGLQGKPAFIVDQLWSAEWGVRMYW